MALEVNFYAGDKESYEAELDKDHGGLYALIDGNGLYRGNEPVAGPCPIDIKCTTVSSSVSESSNRTTFSGTFECPESISFLFEFFTQYHGSGSRPVRVHNLLDTSILMYNSSLTLATEEDARRSVEFVQAKLSPDSSVENPISIRADIYQLKLWDNGDFQFVCIGDNIPLSSTSIADLVERIQKVETSVTWTTLD